jgi:hypothetical protein
LTRQPRSVFIVRKPQPSSTISTLLSGKHLVLRLLVIVPVIST